MRILLVQTSFLGDVVLSTPVIGALRKLYPSAELYMLTTPLAKDLVERDPLLVDVLTYDKKGSEKNFAALIKKSKELKRYNFDIAFTLQRSIRTALLLKMASIKKVVGFESAPLLARFLYSEKRHRPKELHDVLRNLSIVAPVVAENSLDDMRIFLPQESEVSDFVKSFVREKSDFVVMAPGSAWETKRWSEQGYKKVFESLINNNISPVIIGSRGEQAVADRIAEKYSEFNFCGKLTIAETIYLISHAKVLLCNDSMALHLGSALKVPTVVVFCATSPSFGFGPWKNNAIILEHLGLKCKPCARHGSRACPRGTNACMEGVSSDEVLSAVLRLYSGEIVNG